MDIKVKKLPKSEVEISVVLEDADLKADLDVAAKEISKEVKIAGFRPGKIPYDVLVKEVGEDVIRAHAIDIAMPRILTETIHKEKLVVIARPRVNILSKNPVKFEAIAPVYPEIKVDGYEKVKVKMKEVKITEKEVNEIISNIQKQFTEWKEVDRKAVKGDKVEVDFEGFDKDGVSLEGTKSKNHPLILGENMMIPGFEDEIVGLKKEEKKEFELTFPEDYHKKSFQGKKVKFKISVQKVEEPKIPELNEEFIEKISGKKQKEAEFRESVEVDLKQYKEGEEKKNQENDLLEKFLDVTKVEFSDILTDEEVEHMIHEMKHDMQHRGLTFENYLTHIKKTEEDLKKELKKEAIKRITLRFGVNEIMEKEKVEVKDAEIDEEIKKMGPMPEGVNMGEAKGRIANSLRLKRLFDRFVE
ncbi:trigger factor [Patescibacteria group bacterium]|nr:trigger factor [Patescibacteria group bacterium]